MKVLCVHPNFPGQFRHIAAHIAKDRKSDVRYICNPTPLRMEGIKQYFVTFDAKSNPRTHRYLQSFEHAVRRGQAVWRTCEQLKKKGFYPDVIYAHPGWGDSLFLKDSFPNAKLINYSEFYYRPFGADVHFDPDAPVNPDTVARIRIKNSHLLHALEAADMNLCPTDWQKQVHPSTFWEKIRVIHEGIDTAICQPDPDAAVTLANGVTLRHGDPVITYCARNLEPYRGFPQFMKAVAEIHRGHPSCQVIVVGGDEVSYGSPHPSGKSYREVMMAECRPDPARIHFLGKVPHAQLRKIFQVSALHLYLTVPFVLSWSMLEAMACGAVVLGSDTAPVREIITPERNGFLTGFFDSKALAEQALQLLTQHRQLDHIRQQARKTIVEKYRLEDCVKRHVALIEDMLK